MHKQQLLLRHGKSDWNTDSSDFYRPLNKRGTRNAQQMGEWLNEQNLVPDSIISFTAMRAITTVEIVCEAMGLAIDSIKTEQSIYEASVSDLFQVLYHIPNLVQRFLWVG